MRPIAPMLFLVATLAATSASLTSDSTSSERHHSTGNTKPNDTQQREERAAGGGHGGGHGGGGHGGGHGGGFGHIGGFPHGNPGRFYYFDTPWLDELTGELKSSVRDKARSAVKKAGIGELFEPRRLRARQ